MSGRAVDPSRSRIVLVGTSRYTDPLLPDVPVVSNNVADLAAVLTDPEVGGFSPAHCVVAPPRARESVIGDLLVRAASEAEDLLLFYYSGHGLLSPRRRELYLSLADTRQEQVAFTALPFEAIRDACLDSRARSRVVILDSCFSGRAIGETLSDDAVIGQLEVAGTYTLTSAPANRTALILPGERHTAFTERLIRLLQAGSPTAGEMLSLGDIYRHLYAQLQSEGLPVPQQRGTATADLLGLVRNRQFKALSAPSTWSTGILPLRRQQEVGSSQSGYGAPSPSVFPDDRVLKELVGTYFDQSPDIQIRSAGDDLGSNTAMVKHVVRGLAASGFFSVRGAIGQAVMKNRTVPRRRLVKSRLASLTRISSLSMLGFLVLLFGLVSVTGITQISEGKDDSSIVAAYCALIFVIGMTALWTVLLIRTARRSRVIPAWLRSLIGHRNNFGRREEEANGDRPTAPSARGPELRD